jgi:hypothetical protein
LRTKGYLIAIASGEGAAAPPPIGEMFLFFWACPLHLSSWNSQTFFDRTEVTMRRRLYYLVNDIDTVDAIAASLHTQGIQRWHFHVLSKDEAGLYKHRLHSATPLHAHNVLRSGEYGALIGLLAGVVVAALVIGVFRYFEQHLAIAFVIITALITLHGAWTGGMAGLTQDNYRIKRFHDDIEAGRYLLMIDVKRSDRARIQRIMQGFQVEPKGEDSTLVLPFVPGHA